MPTPSIVVVGSSNTDMIIKLDRIPRPGETILGGEFVTAAGGKGANQAVGAARAGGKVTFIARVGRDMFGDQAVAGFGAMASRELHRPRPGRALGGRADLCGQGRREQHRRGGRRERPAFTRATSRKPSGLCRRRGCGHAAGNAARHRPGGRRTRRQGRRSCDPQPGARAAVAGRVARARFHSHPERNRGRVAHGRGGIRRSHRGQRGRQAPGARRAERGGHDGRARRVRGREGRAAVPSGDSR